MYLSGTNHCKKNATTMEKINSPKEDSFGSPLATELLVKSLCMFDSILGYKLLEERCFRRN